MGQVRGGKEGGSEDASQTLGLSTGTDGVRNFLLKNAKRKKDRMDVLIDVEVRSSHTPFVPHSTQQEETIL